MRRSSPWRRSCSHRSTRTATGGRTPIRCPQRHRRSSAPLRRVSRQHRSAVSNHRDPNPGIRLSTATAAHAHAGQGPKRSKTMSAETVEGLEQIIGKLETKHAELIKRNTELTTVRASVAYKALSEDDAKARATLDRVNRDSIEHSAELASVEAALATARGKLAAAEQREANIVRLEQAQAIRREWAEVGVDFDTVDKHLASSS